jgi:chromate reductase, NAD(P)H dehydrogenase (quinone)
MGAYTRQVAAIYAGLLQEMGEETNTIDLKDLPTDFVFSALFENKGTSEGFNLAQEIVHGSQKFVFIVPEYNGSFPGVLKAFLDGLHYPNSFNGKAAGLVGLSSGSMGGALALSHLTDILNYFGTFVMPVKPRLAFIEKNMAEGALTNTLYLELLRMQARQMVDFKCV